MLLLAASCIVEIRLVYSMRTFFDKVLSYLVGDMFNRRFYWDSVYFIQHIIVLTLLQSLFDFFLSLGIDFSQ